MQKETDNPEEYNRHISVSIYDERFWSQHENIVDPISASRVMLDDLLVRMQLTQVPKRFRQSNLVNFPEGAANQARNAIHNGVGLFVFGLRGRGKTDFIAAVMRELKACAAHACLSECWAAREKNGWQGEITRPEIERYLGVSFSEALYRGPRMLFKNAAELMDDIKACFSDGAGQSKQELIELYSTVPVFILDDVGMEKPSVFVQETFDMIINRRWAEQLMSMFTSNLTFDELETHYNDRGRISSRIAGMCEVIELIGEDRRLTR